MSKNVNVNGVDYSGVSQIQMNTTDGGTALFRDVDEITTSGGDSALVSTRATMRTVTITEDSNQTGDTLTTKFGISAGVWVVYLNESPSVYQQIVAASFGGSFARFGQFPTSLPELEVKSSSLTYAYKLVAGTTYTVIEWE